MNPREQGRGGQGEPKKVDVYERFAENEVVEQSLRNAEPILRAVIEGRATFDSVRVYLASSPAQGILTSPDPQLGDLTPMAALRQRILQEQVEQQAAPPSTTTPLSSIPREEILFSPPPMAPRYTRPSQRTVEVHPDKGDYPGHISRPEHISSLGEHVTTAHLSRQEVVNMATVQSLLDKNPQLRILEVPPSQRRLVGPGMRRLLEQHGVQLRIVRRRENSAYDTFTVDKLYRRKKVAYEAMRENPIKSRQFQEMLRLEFPHAIYAQRYFEGDRISVQDIADTEGTTQQRVSRNINVFAHWLGVRSSSLYADQRVGAMLSRLRQLQEIEASEQTRRQYREAHAIGDVLPPVTLPPNRWEIWQHLKRMQQENPARLQSLREGNAFDYELLITYYQIDRNELVSQKGLAERQERSETRIRQRITRALSSLGLLDED
jgi:hypothetical protein